MNWYIAKITFRIAAGFGQFDEQLRLILAASAEEARLKAKTIGIREEEAHPRGSTVAWEFVNVAEVIPLASLADGMELYSQTFETDEPDRHVAFVHQKAMHLQLTDAGRA